MKLRIFAATAALAFALSAPVLAASIQEQNQQARDLVMAGQYNQAASLLDDIITAQPDDYEAYEIRALMECFTKDFKLASIDFTEAIRMNPLPDTDWLNGIQYNRGLAYTNIQKYDAAIKDFSAVIKRDSQFEPLYRERGSAYFHNQDYKKALADWTTQIERYPDDTATLLKLGNLQYKYLQKYDDAIASYTKVLAKNPGNEEALIGRYNAATSKKDYKAALVDVNTLLQQKTDDALLYICRSGLYLDLGKPQEAQADANTAMQLKADYLPAYLLRSYAEKALGNGAAYEADQAKVRQLMKENKDNKKLYNQWKFLGKRK